MKRTLALILTVLLLVSGFTVPVSAACSPDEAKIAADLLFELGLFRGTGTAEDGTPIYSLEKAPTRFEAITMLVRLLGMDEAATSQNWETPFTDLVDWAKPYVGYAYANGLTQGISDTLFGGSDTVSATQYLTFVLRALGYSSATDFKWDSAWEFSDKIGMTNGEYSAENNSDFLRADVAVISNDALDVKLKGSDKTLFESINDRGFGKAETIEWMETKCLLMDGKYYKFAPYYGIGTCSYNGAASQYVQLGDLFYILLILEGDYVIFNSPNKFYGGEIGYGGEYIKDESSGLNIWDLGDLHYCPGYKTDSNSAVECTLYRYDGKEIVIPTYSSHETMTVYFEDEIRCINTGSGLTFVNLQDVFSKLGIKAEIKTSNIEDVGGVWEYVRTK